MKVLKFGGTSVANAENISKVIRILETESKTGNIAVVVSALGGTTDMLIEAGELATQKNDNYLKVFKKITERHKNAVEILIQGPKKKTVLKQTEIKLEALKQILEGIYLINELSNKTKDKIMSFGELLSSYIISEAVQQTITKSSLKDSRELIVTDSTHTNASVREEETTANISDFFKKNDDKIVVIPGFVSRNTAGDTTTLGRGGSDYTAALIATAVKAEALEIWTDVSGMYTANPKLVSQATPIKEISYQEAMELSHFGAKVLYPPTVQPALQKNIPIQIKNTFHPEAEGTLITKKTKDKKNPVKGISHIENIALLTLEGNSMVGVPGFSKRLFSTLSRSEINVVLITQASSEHFFRLANDNLYI